MQHNKVTAQQRLLTRPHMSCWSGLHGDGHIVQRRPSQRTIRHICSVTMWPTLSKRHADIRVRPTRVLRRLTHAAPVAVVLSVVVVCGETLWLRERCV